MLAKITFWLNGTWAIGKSAAGTENQKALDRGDMDTRKERVIGVGGGRRRGRTRGRWEVRE